MTVLLCLCVCVIFSVSVYLVLSRELKSVAMGVFILSHALHLGIIAMAGSPVTPEGEPLLSPILEGHHAPTTTTLETGEVRPKYVDPLPQALILTSIVISFAVTAVMLTLLVLTHRTAGTLRIERLMEVDRPEPPGLA